MAWVRQSGRLSEVSPESIKILEIPTYQNPTEWTSKSIRAAGSSQGCFLPIHSDQRQNRPDVELFIESRMNGIDALKNTT